MKKNKNLIKKYKINYKIYFYKNKKDGLKQNNKINNNKINNNKIKNNKIKNNRIKNN